MHQYDFPLVGHYRIFQDHKANFVIYNTTQRNENVHSTENEGPHEGQQSSKESTLRSQQSMCRQIELMQGRTNSLGKQCERIIDHRFFFQNGIGLFFSSPQEV